MNTRKFKILKAIYLLSSFESEQKITVGELERWTKIPYSSIKRSLVWMYDAGLVTFTEFKRGSVKCRSFSLTVLGKETHLSQTEMF